MLFPEPACSDDARDSTEVNEAVYLSVISLNFS